MMYRGLKRRRTLKVIPIFEPDRMSRINLQVAYERIISSLQYRVIWSKPRDRKVEKVLRAQKEVTV